MNAGRYAEVESRVRVLVSRQPSIGAAWKLYGAALLFQHKEALPALERACQLMPHDAEAHWYLGDAQHAEGDCGAAVESHRRAVSIRPHFAEAHDSLGLALRDLGQLHEAVASHRKALDLRPRYADAFGNLGNALQDLGEFEAARESFQHMLKIEPDVAEAHHSLGNCLLRLGRLEEAAASYGNALAIEPNAVETLANLGNVLRELGRPHDAVACCRRALEIEADFPAAHRYLGNALFDLGRLDQAAGSYGRALALAPRLAEVHSALGMLFRQTGRTADAESACRRALDIEPGSAETLVLLGEIRADQGQFAEARDFFDRALAIDPDLPEAWASLARYRKMGPADGAWLQAALRLLGKGLTLQHEINLRYALGKYFDDTGSFDQAFTNYRLANELTKKKGITYDRERLVRRVDRIVSLYDARWLASALTDAHPSQRPVFVVGMPRAGTTLAEQILASHPVVAGAGELRFWHAAAARYEASLLSGAMAAAPIFSSAEEYLRQLERFPADALRVVDKMPANTMNLGLIHAALPNARIIHMKRNPIDTCLSVYFQIFSANHSYANDLQDIAHYYSQYVRIMNHWRSILPDGAIMDVPYEALVDEPEYWIRNMLGFLGLPWHPDCLDFHRTKRTVVTASNWQVRQKISKSSVGRWHNYAQHVGALRPLMDLIP
jgi:tetratricopeptide (TPR) repeat protein